MGKGPEKQVQKDVLKIARQLGFDLDVVDSKRVFTPSGKLSRRGNAPSGMTDLVGNCPNAVLAVIELKAPGRLSTLRASQMAWMFRKSQLGAFAVVVDSAEMFVHCWQYWRSQSPDGQKAWVSCLVRNPYKEKIWLKNFYNGRKNEKKTASSL